MADIIPEDLSRLQSTLVTSGLQIRDNALYQVITGLILNLAKINKVGGKAIVEASKSGGNVSSGNTIILSDLDSGSSGDGDSTPIPGRDGLQGITGSEGPIGPVVYIEDGIDGNDGFNIPNPGPAGAKGDKGDTGATGPPGTGGSYILLGQGEGTSVSNATPVNVFTLAISGLTVKDSLKVIVTHSSLTQTSLTPIIYNNTDSVTISLLAGGNNITAAHFAMDEVLISTDHQSDKDILSFDNNTGVLASGGTSSGTVISREVNFTTAWTGSWDLALRFGGVNGVGTYHYRIAVFKIAGQ